MKTALIIIVVFALFAYAVYVNRQNKDRELIYGIYLTIITAILGMSLFFTMANSSTMSIYTAAIILIAVIFIMKKAKAMNRDKMKIDARQISFWGVDVNRIKEKFKHRIVKKVGRKEVEIPDGEYFTKKDKNGNTVLQNLKYIDVKKYDKFIKIQDVGYFQSENCTELYKKIYDRMQEINAENEAGLNFNEILKSNNYVLEFFIIDIWERLATHEPLGVATLNAIAVNDREMDLLGALDSAKNSNVGSLGFELFMHYENFKNRLKGY